MIGENGTPVTPEWVCEPRCNPFDCDACEAPQPKIPPNVELGTE